MHRLDPAAQLEIGVSIALVCSVAGAAAFVHTRSRIGAVAGAAVVALQLPLLEARTVLPIVATGFTALLFLVSAGRRAEWAAVPLLAAAAWVASPGQRAALLPLFGALFGSAAALALPGRRAGPPTQRPALLAAAAAGWVVSAARGVGFFAELAALGALALCLAGALVLGRVATPGARRKGVVVALAVPAVLTGALLVTNWAVPLFEWLPPGRTLGAAYGAALWSLVAGVSAVGIVLVLTTRNRAAIPTLAVVAASGIFAATTVLMHEPGPATLSVAAALPVLALGVGAAVATTAGRSPRAAILLAGGLAASALGALAALVSAQGVPP